MSSDVIQHVQHELVGIGDAIALVEGAIASHPVTEQHETFQQASSVLIQQGERILALLDQLETRNKSANAPMTCF